MVRPFSGQHERAWRCHFREKVKAQKSIAVLRLKSIFFFTPMSSVRPSVRSSVYPSASVGWTGTHELKGETCNVHAAMTFERPDSRYSSRSPDRIICPTSVRLVFSNEVIFLVTKWRKT